MDPSSGEESPRDHPGPGYQLTRQTQVHGRRHSSATATSVITTRCRGGPAHQHSRAAPPARMIRWRRRSADCATPGHRVGDDDGDVDAAAFAAPPATRRRWHPDPPGAAPVRWCRCSTNRPRPRHWTSPRRFSVISVRPFRASTRTASVSISLRRSVSRSSPGPDGAGTIRPSHFDTTLLVTTTTSPSRSHGAASAMAAAGRRRAEFRKAGDGGISRGAAVPWSPLGGAVGRGRRWAVRSQRDPAVPVRPPPSPPSYPGWSSAGYLGHLHAGTSAWSPRCTSQ